MAADASSRSFSCHHAVHLSGRRQDASTDPTIVMTTVNDRMVIVGQLGAGKGNAEILELGLFA